MSFRPRLSAVWIQIESIPCKALGFAIFRRNTMRKSLSLDKVMCISRKCWLSLVSRRFTQVNLIITRELCRSQARAFMQMIFQITMHVTNISCSSRDDMLTAGVILGRATLETKLRQSLSRKRGHVDAVSGAFSVAGFAFDPGPEERIDRRYAARNDDHPAFRLGPFQKHRKCIWCRIC